MKQIFKKVSSLCTVLLMMAVLTLTGVSSVWAADEVDDTVKQTLVTTAEGLTDTSLLSVMKILRIIPSHLMSLLLEQ